MTMIYSNSAQEQEAGALPDVEVWQHYHLVRDLTSPLPYSERERVCESSWAVLGDDGVCRGAGWYWQAGSNAPKPGVYADTTLRASEYSMWTPDPDSEPVGPFATEAEAVADAQSDAPDDDDSSSRQCIDCECHRVPWNQGSDYCDECHTDSETQRTPHDAQGSEPDDELPPCVLAMRCLCAGHARGNPASAPCDTNEEA